MEHFEAKPFYSQHSENIRLIHTERAWVSGRSRGVFYPHLTESHARLKEYRDEILGRTVYFHVILQADLPKDPFSKPKDHFSLQFRKRNADDILVQTYEDLKASKASAAIRLFAKDAAQDTLRAHGTVINDTRTIRISAPLSPQEQNQLNAVFGSDKTALLGATIADLKALGLGSILAQRPQTDVPDIVLKQTTKTKKQYAIIRLVCQL